MSLLLIPYSSVVTLLWDRALSSRVIWMFLPYSLTREEADFRNHLVQLHIFQKRKPTWKSYITLSKSHGLLSHRAVSGTPSLPCHSHSQAVLSHDDWILAWISICLPQESGLMCVLGLGRPLLSTSNRTDSPLALAFRMLTTEHGDRTDTPPLRLMTISLTVLLSSSLSQAYSGEKYTRNIWAARVTVKPLLKFQQNFHYIFMNT